MALMGREKMGGLKTDGETVDPVSGNKVPLGSNADEVRDDIPAQLSDGEYVVPADVVRFFGVSFFEKLRTKAKKGIEEMGEDGRINGEPIEDASMQAELSPEEMTELESILQMDEGGMSSKSGALKMVADQITARGVAPQTDFSKFTKPGSFTAASNQGISQSQTSAITAGFIEYVGPNGEIMMIPVDANGNPIMPVPQGYTKKTSGAETARVDSGGDDDPTDPFAQHKNIQEAAQKRNQDWFDNFHGADDPLAMAKSLLEETPAGLGGIVGSADTLGDIAKIRGYSMAIESTNSNLAEQLNDLVEESINNSGFGVKALEGILATGGMYGEKFTEMLSTTTVVPTASIINRQRQANKVDTKDGVYKPLGVDVAMGSSGSGDRDSMHEKAVERSRNLSAARKSAMEKAQKAGGSSEDIADLRDKYEKSGGTWATGGRAKGGLVKKPAKKVTPTTTTRRKKSK